jgi:hypothetical protein
MKPKIALFISAALTAFALVTVGGVISNVRTAGAVQEPTAAPTEEAVLTPTIDTSVQQALNEREAAYQDLIAQANARLAEAQQAQQALQAQLAALQNPVVPEAAASFSIAPEDAAGIAAQYMGRADLYSVETSVLNGNTVYKVVFSSGDIVYLSLDGQVLGVAPAPVTVSSDNGSGGSGGSGGHREHEDEHENEDHDD